MTHESILAQEIAAQPAELSALIDREAAGIARFIAGLHDVDYAIMGARGTSDHAATYARYIWGYLGRLPVVSSAPSLHTIYGVPPRMKGALVVGISQSGQSPDVVAVVEEGKRQGRPTLALTNDPHSPLGRAADHVVTLCLTPERSIAATKTYTTELMAVALVGAALSGDSKRRDEALRIPDAAQKVLVGAKAAARDVAARLKDVSTVLPIARGINLCTAEEMALKLRELLRVSTHAFSAADFRHGSIALVTDGLPVALIAPRGEAFDDMRALAEEIRGRGGSLVVISDDPKLGEAGDGRLPMAHSVPEWLSPLTAILPAQLLAVEMGLAKGLNPDKPRGLAEKVVKTV